MKQIILLSAFLILGSISQSQEVRITDVFVENEFRAAAIKYGETINVSITYDISIPEGARIFARPFTNGQLTDGYGATGSAVLTGSGLHTQEFSINPASINTVIDEIRIQAVSVDQTERYMEFYVPVQFLLGDVSIQISNLYADPRGASFLNDERHDMDLSYDAMGTDGYRIWIQGFRDGEFAGGYQGSQLMTDAGLTTRFVTDVEEVSTLFDSLRILYTPDSDQPELYREFFVPVNWLWSKVKVTNIVSAGSSWPLNGADVTPSYDYEVQEGSSVRIFVRPMSCGELTPDYGASGSPLFTGIGSDDAPFTINSGNHRVDGLRFKFTGSDSSIEYGEIVFPVEHIFGDLLVTSLTFSPPSPARLLPAEVGIEFIEDYVTTDYIVSNDHPYGVRSYTIPDINSYVNNPNGLIDGDSFGVMEEGFFAVTENDVKIDKVFITTYRAEDDSMIAKYGYMADYYYTENYVNPCGNDAAPLSAPVDLTKSFRPVPFPSGNVDRVQVKWYKDSPKIKYQALDAVGCDIQFWPVKDLASNTLIVGADSVVIENTTKDNKPLFKWPIMFRKDGANNSKKVEPSTRYKWRVRCACNEGLGTESDWSEIKFFNTPAFDPATGIYTPPAGQYLSEAGEVKSTGEEGLELQAYPNPVQNELTIQSEQAIGLDRIEILDITGRIVMQEQGLGDKQMQYRLDLSGLRSGLYLARVQAGAMEQVIRFEKH